MSLLASSSFSRNINSWLGMLRLAIVWACETSSTSLDARGSCTCTPRTPSVTLGVHNGNMETNLLLLADTHIPTRAKRLPEAVLEAIDAADIVVHAGDWIDL